MYKRMLFIYNPHAGKGQIKNHLIKVIDIFIQGGYEVTIHSTQYIGDATVTTRERRKEYDVLVCCGGDGTLDEVVTGMMDSEERIPIGYIPAGSTNDFAKSLKIPRIMSRAAEIVMKDKRFACDVGSFNDNIFIYIAAFGVFTDVSYETKQEAKNRLGYLAYIMEGMKRLTIVNNSYRLRIEYGSKVIEEEFLFGMITNSYSVGGFKSITGKNVKLNDGLFEVTLIKRPKNPLEIQGIMASLIAKETDERYMYSFKTDQLKITSEGKIPWTLDGEFGGEQKEVLIKNHKEALEIIVPLKKNANK